MYLKVNNFHKDKKVYVIGGEGILEELQIAGFTGLGGPVSSFFQYVLVNFEDSYACNRYVRYLLDPSV